MLRVIRKAEKGFSIVNEKTFKKKLKTHQHVGNDCS
jgi:hypothetical protein